MAELEQKISDLNPGTNAELTKTAWGARDVILNGVTKRFNFEQETYMALAILQAANWVQPANANNPLVNKEYVDNHVGARLFSDAQGGGWTSVDLLNHGPWYTISGTPVSAPHQGMWGRVYPDATHDGKMANYYYNDNTHVFVFVDVVDLSLTPEEQAAIDSGITIAMVNKIKNLQGPAAEDNQSLTNPTSDDYNVTAISTTLSPLLQLFANKIQTIRDLFFRKSQLISGTTQDDSDVTDTTSYVDILAQIVALGSKINGIRAKYLRLDGGTMTGRLMLAGDATADLEAVTLRQLNNFDEGFAHIIPAQSTPQWGTDTMTLPKGRTISLVQNKLINYSLTSGDKGFLGYPTTQVSSSKNGLWFGVYITQNSAGAYITQIGLFIVQWTDYATRVLNQVIPYEKIADTAIYPYALVDHFLFLYELDQAPFVQTSNIADLPDGRFNFRTDITVDVVSQMDLADLKEAMLTDLQELAIDKIGRDEADGTFAKLAEVQAIESKISPNATSSNKLTDLMQVEALIAAMASGSDKDVFGYGRTLATTAWPTPTIEGVTAFDFSTGHKWVVVKNTDNVLVWSDYGSEGFGLNFLVFIQIMLDGTDVLGNNLAGFSATAVGTDEGDNLKNLAGLHVSAIPDVDLKFTTQPVVANVGSGATASGEVKSTGIPAVNIIEQGDGYIQGESCSIEVPGVNGAVNGVNNYYATNFPDYIGGAIVQADDFTADKAPSTTAITFDADVQGDGGAGGRNGKLPVTLNTDGSVVIGDIPDNNGTGYVSSNNAIATYDDKDLGLITLTGVIKTSQRYDNPQNFTLSLPDGDGKAKLSATLHSYGTLEMSVTDAGSGYTDGKDYSFAEGIPVSDVSTIIYIHFYIQTKDVLGIIIYGTAIVGGDEFVWKFTKNTTSVAVTNDLTGDGAGATPIGIAEKALEVAPDTTPFVSGATLNFASFWQSVLNKINGLFSSGGGGGGTVSVTSDLTGNGSSASPVGINAKSLAITPDTTPFTSGATLTYAAFWQSVLNKINGILSGGGGGGTVSVTSDLTGNGSSTSPVGINAKSLAITPDTTPFTSGATLTYAAFWQSVLNKINGILSGGGGGTVAVTDDLTGNGSSTDPIGINEKSFFIMSDTTPFVSGATLEFSDFWHDVLSKINGLFDKINNYFIWVTHDLKGEGNEASPIGVNTKALTITPDTTLFTSGATLTFTDFWQAVLNKINGILSGGGGFTPQGSVTLTNPTQAQIDALGKFIAGQVTIVFTQVTFYDIKICGFVSLMTDTDIPMIKINYSALYYVSWNLYIQNCTGRVDLISFDTTEGIYINNNHFVQLTACDATNLVVGSSQVQLSGASKFTRANFKNAATIAIDDDVVITNLALENAVLTPLWRWLNPDFSTELLFVTTSGTAWLAAVANTVSIVSSGFGISSNRTMEYSLGEDWLAWDGSPVKFDNITGIKLRGTITADGGELLFTHFQFTTEAGGTTQARGIKTFGNIQSINGGGNDIDYKCSNYSMFTNCTAIISAPDLPAITLSEHCYAAMFQGCSSLTKAPALPASTLASNCYEYMFFGCTNLISAPDLPAANIAANCYENMFQNCSSLKNAPSVLPAPVLADSCYEDMFFNCVNLLNAPELPATTLNVDCYHSMFGGCTSLTTPPELPATTLADNCYNKMFQGCTSLKEAPALPAITMTTTCYLNMFQGCTSLIKAPELPATYLANGCYDGMFAGCTALTSVPALPAISLADGCYEDMFSGCTSLEIYTQPTQYSNYEWRIPTEGLFSSIGTKSFDNMLTNTGGDAPATPAPAVNEYLTYYAKGVSEAELVFKTASGTAYIAAADSIPDIVPDGFGISSNRTMEYNIGAGWVSWNGSPVQFDNVTGIKLRGTITADGQEGLYTHLQFTTAAGGMDPAIGIHASGDIQALNGGGFVINYKYAFTQMFANCAGLITAPDLPAMTLSEGCYLYMFAGCERLLNAPELPAMNLAEGCYESMFMECTTLTAAPELPATSLARYCYSEMFSGCNKLISVPVNLPATTLAANCYDNMFVGCTRLTIAPKLPATTLAPSCYEGMFSGCLYLANAPLLPATTLATSCYRLMFNACRALTDGPELPATTLAVDCYEEMFENCSGLLASPELPATTLASGCYNEMFAYCTNLTNVPALPATTLPDGCYQYMFKGCTSLDIYTTSTGTSSVGWKIPTVGTFAAIGSEVFDSMLESTGGDAPATPAPSVGASLTYYAKGVV